MNATVQYDAAQVEFKAVVSELFRCCVGWRHELAITLPPRQWGDAFKIVAGLYNARLLYALDAAGQLPSLEPPAWPQGVVEPFQPRGAFPVDALGQWTCANIREKAPAVEADDRRLNIVRV